MKQLHNFINLLSITVILISCNSKAQTNLNISVDEFEKDFSDFETIQIEVITRNVNEGKYHNGMASVIQLVGEK